MDLKFTLNWFTVAWEVFHAYLYDFFSVLFNDFSMSSDRIPWKNEKKLREKLRWKIKEKQRQREKEEVSRGAEDNFNPI